MEGGVCFRLCVCVPFPPSPARNGWPRCGGIVEPPDGDGEHAALVGGVDAALHVCVPVELDLPFVVTCANPAVQMISTFFS